MRTVAAFARDSSLHALPSDWWRKAEDETELEHVHGMGWHSLRRQFATDLKDVPLRDLCELGGWKSHQTVLTCYQQPEEDRMREALRARGRPPPTTGDAPPLRLVN